MVKNLRHSVATIAATCVTCTALCAALFAASGSLSGCATRAASALPEQSLYQRLGGYEGINAVVVDAIGNISTDSRINARFTNAAAANALSKNLTDLICLRAGGPCKYTGLDMSAAHEGMQIRDDEFDALAEDLVKSFNKFRVPAREQRETLTILGQMRNSIVGH